MYREIQETLNKQLQLLAEHSQNQSCSARDIADMSLAMAEIARVIQYPIFVQEANRASHRC